MLFHYVVHLAYYNMLGLDYQRNRNLIIILLLNKIILPQTGGYIHNFHTTAIVPSLEALVSFNNIMFHNKQGQMEYLWLSWLYCFYLRN